MNIIIYIYISVNKGIHVSKKGVFMKEIEVKNFTKDYGFGRGVFDISFEVNKGEVLGFLGPNGAGKSTTIRHLMGFSKPEKGSTRILGQDTFENYVSFMDKVGYLPGEIALPDGLTGFQLIDMMKKMKAKNRRVYFEKKENNIRNLYIRKIWETAS